ncbi:MAG TPA: SDR family NAD(P)-dependent oxidoreductase [Terriglobia bacterium]|nr:SDR family NAD(P)-dependent oxidoreductase [Terriglobia bacterium]
MFIDKTAIITGASRGIGLAIGRRLHRDGARVALCARSLDALNAHVAELGADRAIAVPMDIRDPDGVHAAMDTIARQFGKIDIVVNNAGVSGVTPIDAPSSAPWSDIVMTNLFGTYYVTRAAMPYISDGGRILVISSVLGKFGVPGYSAYCASKTGLIGFVRALALELAPRRIAVNAICPGWTDTEMAWSGMRDISSSLGVALEEFKRDAMARVPLGEMVQPGEVAGLVAFLASDAGRNITAQAISICGGSTQA